MNLPSRLETIKHAEARTCCQSCSGVGSVATNSPSSSGSQGTRLSPAKRRVRCHGHWPRQTPSTRSWSAVRSAAQVRQGCMSLQGRCAVSRLWQVCHPCVSFPPKRYPMGLAQQNFRLHDLHLQRSTSRAQTPRQQLRTFMTGPEPRHRNEGLRNSPVSPVHAWWRSARGRRGLRLPRGEGPLLHVHDAAAQGVRVRLHLKRFRCWDERPG